MDARGRAALSERRRLSKALAYHLRHDDVVALLPGGWARIEALRDVLRPRPSLTELHDVVTSGPAARFELSDDGALVRARYGHSRDVELDYRASQPPDLLFHGTAASAVRPILVDGLRRRGRRHVHLSETVPAARRVGARHGSPVVLQVAAGRMVADGLLLFHAADGTWLTAAVPPGYVTIG